MIRAGPPWSRWSVRRTASTASAFTSLHPRRSASSTPSARAQPPPRTSSWLGPYRARPWRLMRNCRCCPVLSSLVSFCARLFSQKNSRRPVSPGHAGRPSPRSPPPAGPACAARPQGSRQAAATRDSRAPFPPRAVIKTRVSGCGCRALVRLSPRGARCVRDAVPQAPAACSPSAFGMPQSTKRHGSPPSGRGEPRSRGGRRASAAPSALRVRAGCRGTPRTPARRTGRDRRGLPPGGPGARDPGPSMGRRAW